MNTGEGTISLADSLGNLLFYSDGKAIWDKTNIVMPNGYGLHGTWQPFKPALSFKRLANDSTFYLFTVGEARFMPSDYFGLYYSVVDLRLHNGLGDIPPTLKNIPLNAADSAFDYLCGTRAWNNRDVWVIVKKYISLTNLKPYMAFKVTPAGIDTIPVVSSSGLVSLYPYTSDGVIKISPDGTRLITTGTCQPWGNRMAEFCHFNNKTGQVTPEFIFKPSISSVYPRFIEFSGNGHFVYIEGVNNNGQHPLFQYDATIEDSAGFMASEVYLGNNCTSMQLASNGKIYINDLALPPVTDSMHVINFPNNHGVACGFQRHVLVFNNNNSGNGSIPQFIQNYKAYIHKTGDCQSDSVHFSGDIWPPPDSVRWNFGDPTSGTANISTGVTPAHVYSATGTYTVELYVRHNDNRTDTTWKTIIIKTGPQPALGPDQTICAGQTTTLDAGAWSGCTYEWKDLGSGLVVGTNQTYTTGAPGAYAVMVTGPNGCTGKDTIQLFLGTPTVVTATITTGTTTICAGTPVTYTASGNPTGTSPSWQWKVNGVNTGTGGQVFTDTPSNGDCITCVLTSNAFCVTGNPATSNQICMTVNQLNPVSLTITSTSSHTCAGTPVTFNAFPTNPG
ncbi:MAG: PKD domain-containing protein, partial [Bacteroidota bacterium]